MSGRRRHDGWDVKRSMKHKSPVIYEQLGEGKANDCRQ